MAVGILHLPFREEPEHGPQGVGDGPGLREIGVGKKNAEPIRLTAYRIFDNLLKFGLGLGMLEDGRLESLLGGGDSEIPEQRGVVHPVHTGFALGMVNSFAMRG